MPEPITSHSDSYALLHRKEGHTAARDAARLASLVDSSLTVLQPCFNEQPETDDDWRSLPHIYAGTVKPSPPGDARWCWAAEHEFADRGHRPDIPRDIGDAHGGALVDFPGNGLRNAGRMEQISRKRGKKRSLVWAIRPTSHNKK